jgi:serine/threonine protein phosphatase PrpC
VNSYGGYSKKGYAPYNAKKKNQDALVMAEDPKTRSLLLCVMDGHGEDGDKVSQNIKSKFASYLFKHPEFAGNVKTALTEVIARCEAEILRGRCCMYSEMSCDQCSISLHHFVGDSVFRLSSVL